MNVCIILFVSFRSFFRKNSRVYTLNIALPLEQYLWVPNPIGCGFGGHIRRDEVLIVGSGEDAAGIEVVVVELWSL